jgi:hypothetical protein
MHSAQAAHNATDAVRLLAYLKTVDLRLARLMVMVARKTSEAGRKLCGDLKGYFKELVKLLDMAAKVMYAYSGRGFLMRSLLSTHDSSMFKSIETNTRNVMQVSVCMTAMLV